MAIRGIRVKIRENTLNQVKNWFRELNERKGEVLESLKNEGIIVESAFLDRINNFDYLIYYIKSDDIQRALEIFQKSSLPIDEFYKDNWQRFFEDVVVLDPVFDVDLLS